MTTRNKSPQQLPRHLFAPGRDESQRVTLLCPHCRRRLGAVHGTPAGYEVEPAYWQGATAGAAGDVTAQCWATAGGVEWLCVVCCTRHRGPLAGGYRLASESTTPNAPRLARNRVSWAGVLDLLAGLSLYGPATNATATVPATKAGLRHALADLCPPEAGDAVRNARARWAGVCWCSQHAGHDGPHHDARRHVWTLDAGDA